MEKRAQWKDFHENKDIEETDQKTHIPTKLKIPTISLPPQTDISKEIKNYTKLIHRKVETLKEKVKQNFKFKNNLNNEMKIALKELKKLVNQNKIVITNSDKDGKILILNFEDYIHIVSEELKKFEEIKTNTSLTNFINQTKAKAELKVENLNKINVIDENILFHTIGKNTNKSGILSKITGPKAKYF